MDSLFETRLREAFASALRGDQEDHYGYVFGHSVFRYVKLVQRRMDPSRNRKLKTRNLRVACADCRETFDAYTGSSTRCIACRPMHEWRWGFSRHLTQTYGISIDDYAEMYNRQNGVCAICKSVSPDSAGYKQRMSVDHDHATGKVRGLLCNLCNRGLGQFGDYLATLQNAVTYLEGCYK